jgi:hypothetical protein
MKKFTCLWKLMCAVSLTAAIAWSQSSFTASVRGSVTDPSGAALPKAKVTITEAERNVPHSVITDDAGRYSLSALPPGKYTLSVEAQGFKKFMLTDVTLAVQQQATLNVPLQVGDIATSVQVEGTTPLLNTTIATLGQVIDNRYMMSLPNLGRNPLALISLTPGVVGAAGATSAGTSTNFVANGARNSTSDVLVDGAIVNTTEQNTGATDLKYTPSVDAVLEFKMQTNFFGAEYAESGGAIVNVVTKSGTNDFHGTAYYFRRDSALFANSWANNRVGAKKTYTRRDQPGGVFGGPIRKNKTFFFGTFEYTHSKSPQTLQGTVPTQDQRNGNFTTTYFTNGQMIQMYNPFSTFTDSTGAVKRNPFPGNIIPSNMIDPVVSKVLKYFPLANATPTNALTYANNFYAAGINVGATKQADIKIDNTFNDKLRAGGRYSIARTNAVPANLFAQVDPAIGAAYSPNDGPNHTYTQSASGNLTYLQNPTTVWVLNYGFVYSEYERMPFQDFDSSTLGLPKYMYDNATFKTFPMFDGFGMLQVGTQGYVILDRQEGVHQLSASMTKTKGGHNIKAGTEFRHNFLDYAQPGYPQGHFTFGQQTTSQDLNTSNSLQGSGFASFLLGFGNGGNYHIDPKAFPRANYWGFFVQDDWKVTRKLTLNLGLRYEFDVPRTELQNRYSYWDLNAPAPISVPGYTLKGVYKFADNNTRSPFDADHNNVAPRLGFAYALNSKTSIRAGAGIFYTLSRATVAGHTGSPFNTDSGMTFTLDSGATQYAKLSNPYPNGLTLPLGSSLGDKTFLGRGAGTIVRSTGQNPEMYSWNVSLQREVGWDSVLEINYTGSRGLRLYNPYTSLTPLDPSYWGIGRTALQAKVPNPFYGVITDPQAVNLNAPTVQYYRLLRNMPQFDGASGSEPNTADSIYHGLQIKWEKRFSRGVTMIMHYTWSKSIDDISTTSGNLTWLGGTTALQDPLNLKLERSLSGNDIAHRFIATGDYQIPVGRGRHFASGVNRVVDGVIGGWELSGFLTLQSGPPLQVSQNGGNIWNGTQRPNLIGDPSTSGSIYDRMNNYLNVAAFSQPAIDVRGTAPRYLGLRGPAVNTLDAALLKSWKTTERQRLEFRLEASNVRNHPVFANPGTTFGSSTFGQITGTKVGSRNMQLGLKYYF